MIEFLVMAIIVNGFVLLGILLFIWVQFNSTDSKLIKLVENRIRLNNLSYDLDKLEFPIIEEE